MKAIKWKFFHVINKNWLKILVVCFGCVWFTYRIVLVLYYRPYDLQINITGVQNWLQNGELYAWVSSPEQIKLFYSFISTPFVGLIIYPLTQISLFQAVLIYRIISIVLYLASVLLILITIFPSIEYNRIAAWFLLLSLIWEPTFVSISLGQINEITLFFLSVALWGMKHQKTGAAALGIGIASLIKVFPVIWLIYWAYKCQWKLILLTLGVITIGGLASCGVFGQTSCTNFIFHVLPTVGRGSSYHYNITINGFLSRLYQPVPVWYGLDAQPLIPSLRYITYLLLLAGYFIFSSHTYRTLPHGQPDIAFDFSLFIVFILIFSPIGWWHYNVWLLIPIAVCLMLSRIYHLPRRFYWIGIFSFILISISPEWLWRHLSLHWGAVISNIWVSLPLLGNILLLWSLLNLKKLARGI